MVNYWSQHWSDIGKVIHERATHQYGYYRPAARGNRCILNIVLWSRSTIHRWIREFGSAYKTDIKQHSTHRKRLKRFSRPF